METHDTALEQKQDACNGSQYIDSLASPRFADRYETGGPMVIEWYGRDVIKGQTLAFWFDLKTEQSDFTMSILQNGTVEGAASEANSTKFLSPPFQGMEVRDECNRAGIRYNWTIPANLYNYPGAGSPFVLQMRASVNYNFNWGAFASYSTANSTVSTQSGIIIEDKASATTNNGTSDSTTAEVGTSDGVGSSRGRAVAIGVGVGAGVAGLLLIVFLIMFYRRRKRRTVYVEKASEVQDSDEVRDSPEPELEDEDIQNYKLRPQDLHGLLKPTGLHGATSMTELHTSPPTTTRDGDAEHGSRVATERQDVTSSGPGEHNGRDDKEALKVPLDRRPGRDQS